MPTTDPTVLAAFAGTVQLSDIEAQAILRETANAIWNAFPPSGRLVDDRLLLLGLLADLAAGGKAVTRLAAVLPFPADNARKYLESAARVFLEQAERDSARGLNPAASVWVEVSRAGRQRPELPTVVSGDVAFRKSDGQRDASADLEQASESPPWTDLFSLDFSRDSENEEKVFRRARPAMAPAPGGQGGGFLNRMRNLRLPTFGFGPRRILPTAPPLIVMHDPGVVVASAAPQSEQPKADEYRVWFGTNRHPSGGGAGTFGNKRGGSVSYGYCDVYIPKSHKIGSVGSSFLWRLVNFTDDRLTLRRTRLVSVDAYWSKLRAQLAGAADGRRHAVVFIHGYNVAFEEAALRAAQIGVDLSLEGAMAFFSWPSKGTVDGYHADEATIDASEPAITEFLVDFARKSGAEAVHVIAHSMGNRGVLRAVSKVVQNAQERTDVHFANFILAAPDVDADTFANFAAAYQQLADRTTLYVSERDRAVSLSRWLHEYSRVGFAPPINVFEGIDTVNVTSIDLTMLGHGYVGEAREILSDMHALIFEGLPPARRFSLRAAKNDADKVYWILGG